MKLSVSLPEDDVVFLDALVQEATADSRSAALHQAVGSLRASRLESAYEAAWGEWTDTGEADAWEGAVGDGLHAPG